ncbi:hypothetical protein KO527_22265 [Pseudoalteromonas sp. C2R02]|uniref:hypothetical protein n=1 Tax=Pseudoalteromonas sp. C2R02 TaxID=2841565 RepID=UPI001C092E4D|nr:hypothetical protein [Pseudoalteromonas sp. C2R02]MBU2972066.1 hypothetical protein [Pseudoalteromonas sp. C2R02]
MNKLLLITVLMTSFTATAGFDEKIAASFAAKYEVCALKIKDSNPFLAIKLKAKADSISRDKLGGGGYIEAYAKEKKKAWFLSKEKCIKMAKKIS